MKTDCLVTILQEFIVKCVWKYIHARDCCDKRPILIGSKQQFSSPPAFKKVQYRLKKLCVLTGKGFDQKTRFPISTFPYLNKIWRTNSYYCAHLLESRSISNYNTNGFVPLLKLRSICLKIWR